jgi:hypothetical protein
MNEPYSPSAPPPSVCSCSIQQHPAQAPSHSSVRARASSCSRTGPALPACIAEPVCDSDYWCDGAAWRWRVATSAMSRPASQPERAARARCPSCGVRLEDLEIMNQGQKARSVQFATRDCEKRRTGARDHQSFRRHEWAAHWPVARAPSSAVCTAIVQTIGPGALAAATPGCAANSNQLERGSSACGSIRWLPARAGAIGVPSMRVRLASRRLVILPLCRIVHVF